MKKIMKRLVMLLMVTAFIVNAVGCGAEQPSNDNTKETTEENKNVVLKVWLPSHSDSENKALKEIFEEFNTSTEGRVKAEYEFIPRGNTFAYEDKVSAAVTYTING